MRAVLAGAGAREALERGGGGTVVASFSRACYLDIAGAQLVLVAPDVYAGPVHLVLDADPPRPEPGRAVLASETTLILDGERIDVARVAPWLGELPPPVAIGEHAREISSVALAAAAGSALLRAPFEALAGRARELLMEGRLEEAASRLAGLGPGLTPSGDDALAGIAFGLRAALGPGIEPRAAGLAGALAPGSLGRAFVSYAGTGQALAPVHDLVCRVVAGDAAGTAAAAGAVAAIGETSGRDLLLGLGWALSGSALYEIATSGGAPGSGIRTSGEAWSTTSR